MANKNQMESIETVDALSKSEAFFIQNKKAIIIAVVALFVIIAGFFLYKSFVSTPRENKASTELGKGQELFNMEQFDKALNGDSTNYAGFVKIAADYSGTKAGNLANLYAGLCYAGLNKWQDAVKYLDAYSPSDDAIISPAAVAALGNNGQFYVVHGIDTQRIAVDAIITLGYQRAGACQFGPVIEKDAVAIVT